MGAWMLAAWTSLALLGEPTEPGRIPPDTGYLPPHALPTELSLDASAASLVRPPATEDPGPATAAGERLLAWLDEILAEVADLPPEQHRYAHRFRVHRGERVFHFDCSQMLSWALSHRAPLARAGVNEARPVAWHYYRRILTAPSSSFAEGWQRVARLSEVRPGDIFAWRRPDSWPMGASSGHVGVVRAAPVPVPTLERAYLVRIIDATSEPHQDDTRVEGATGLGEGTMLFLTDAEGRVEAYGWEGLESLIWVRTDVQFGRILR